MASRTDKEEVFELDEEVETNYPVGTKQQKPGSSAKFYETESQRHELLMTNMERLIHHFDNHLEETNNEKKKTIQVQITELTNKIESLKTLLEKQLKEKENEIKNLQKEAAAELDTHKKEIEHLKSENLKLTNELASCKNDAKTEHNKMITMKKEAINKLQKEAAAKFGTHKKKIQNLKSENQKLTNELVSCKNDAKTEHNKMMPEKEAAIQKLQKDIKIEKARTTTTEEQLKEMLATATAEKNDLKCIKTKLEEKVKETEQRIKLLQSENYALQQQIAKKQIQYDELSKEKLENKPLAELDPNKKEIQSLKNLLEDNHSLRQLNKVDLPSKLGENSSCLWIHDRTINYVAPGTFDKLSSLTKLDLSYSGLSFLEKGVFNNLTNLIHLNLLQNYLTCLEGNVFAGLKKLKKISLYDNNITKFPPQLFRGLESLEYIELSGNNISVFDEYLLVGLNGLTRFDADNNNLTSIPEKLFENCVKLEWVWLQNNKIVRLNKTIFDSLHNLRTLHLRNNPLNEKDKNALRMLKIGNFEI